MKRVEGWNSNRFRPITRMLDLGVQPHFIETIINHVSGYKAGVASERSRTKTRTRANEGYFAVQR
jgi:hypothetical protein